MRRPFALLATTAAVVLALGLLAPHTARGDGLGKWLKFLFTPQAGLNSAGFSCGWHQHACSSALDPGPALDFPSASADAGDAVYFRSFGFKPSGGDEWVAFGTPYTVSGGICVETAVRMRDKDAYNTLGWMRYMHTYKTRDADMLMYVSQNGHKNEEIFARMAKEPWNYAVPESQRETWDCYNANYWTGIHVHEYHVNQDDNIFLRDGGDCTPGDRYPCAEQPWPYPTRNPQDWGSDWARIFCINDTDCDGWTDDQESHVGTDSWDACPDNLYDAAWPPDTTNNRTVDVLDVVKFIPKLGYSQGQPGYDQRYDLKPDWSVNVRDVVVYIPLLQAAARCTN
jgi:hypothetical protein